MTDILRRNLAPLTGAAWELIEEQAARILKGNLSARAVVDVDGPKGMGFAAVTTGAVEAGRDELVKGVEWGLRRVQALAEVRVPFVLSLADLDQVERGGKTPDLAPVIAAAQQAALFEEKAVYHGFKAAGIAGILPSASSKPVVLKEEAGLVRSIEDAVHAIQRQGIGGPFHLVLGRGPFQALAAGADCGYPLRKRIEALLGGSIVWSPAVDGGVVLSGRGGDFELTIGQDLSIGYTSTGGDKVNLFVLESFTFRVLEPAAAVELKPAKG